MIIEKHPINEEAIEEVYDFFELVDVELVDGTGKVKTKIGTFKRSQLVTSKESLTEQIAEIDNKLNSIDSLE